MGEGVLQFTLGLATGNFLSALSSAGDGLKTFLGGLVSFGAIADGVMNAFEKGAGLEALHRRTGQSVQDLYELQKGFQAAGLSGDDVQSTLLHMQRSIGGVNEMGDRTPDIFRRLGLNIETLRGQNAPAQLQSIVAALGQLNTASAANTAGSIFGRADYANVLQLVNGTKGLGTGMAAAAEQGKNFQRVSAAFFQIENSLNKLKSLGTGFFAGIAEGLVRPLQMGLDLLNSMKDTITEIGTGIGRMFTGVAEAFKESKMTELLQMSFAAGVEFFVNMLAGTIGSGSFWEGIFEIMAGNFIAEWGTILEFVASIGEVLMAAFDTAFDHLFELIGKTPVLGDKLGLKGYKAETFGQNFLDEKKKGQAGMDVVHQVTQFGMDMAVGGGKDIGQGVTDAFKNSGGPAQDALKKFFGGLVDKVPALPKSAKVKAAGEGEQIEQKSDYKPEFTQFEKMGFVMNGANNPMLDFARRTAVATEKLANALTGGGAAPAQGPAQGPVNSV